MALATLAEPVRDASAPPTPPLLASGETILALDLGTRCGWAAAFERQILSGVAEFRPGAVEAVGHGGFRWVGEVVGRAGGQQIVLAVADEVHRVLVGWGRIVLRGEPMVEAKIARLRLVRRIELAVAMPLPRLAGGVAGVFEKLRDGGFLSSHVDLLAGIGLRAARGGNPIVNPGPVGAAPGE